MFKNCISCDFTVFIAAELVPLSVAGVIQRQRQRQTQRGGMGGGSTVTVGL